MRLPAVTRRFLRSMGLIPALLACGAFARGADTYSAGQLTMPAVMIGNATYTNMVVTIGRIVTPPPPERPPMAASTSMTR